MGKKNIFDEILKDQIKRKNEAMREIAEKVARQIEDGYKSAIDAFYKDYEPEYYDRTYETYRGSSGYDNLYGGIQQFGDLFYTGINVSSSNIPGNPYRAYKGWVFDRTFYHGIHGLNRNDIIRMNKNYKKGDVRVQMRAPKNMTPPPEKLMDKEFKLLKKQLKDNKYFEDIMLKHGFTTEKQKSK